MGQNHAQNSMTFFLYKIILGHLKILSFFVIAVNYIVVFNDSSLKIIIIVINSSLTFNNTYIHKMNY